MNCHRFLSGLILSVGTAFVLVSPGEVQAQSSETVEPYPEDLPATGDINDLNGLQERQVSDWFPQGNVSTDSQTLLQIDSNNAPPLTVNDTTTQIREQDNWQRNPSGDPKQTGPGLPFGTF